MNSQKFFAELQRRNVYKVGVAYGVVSWLIIQIATQVFPFFDIPNWVTRMVVILLLLGFPVAMVLAWAYELTPEGLKLTDEVPPSKSIVRRTARKLDLVIIAVLLAVIAVFAYERFGPAGKRSPDSKKSIAVLPFLDLSQNKDQEYFSDGISEQIINSLAKIRGLFVVARTSAFVFKNKPEDIRDVGNRLHVTHVLEGSVNHSSNKIRVDTRLIDVSNGYQLWSETYDSNEQDILSLQSDVAKKVANALQIELHLAEATQLAKPPTQDSEAYDFYLRGQYLLNKRTADSVQKGRAFFEQAIAKDPRFALGHAGIADSYILLGKLGSITPAEVATKAWSEVSAALAIDENLAEAHVSRATLLTDFEWNWSAAEVDFKKALELDSNSVKGHYWYARHLAELDRSGEALREIAAAEKLDPLSPSILTAKGKILFVAHRDEEAIASCRKAIDLEVNFAQAYSVLAQAQGHRREFAEAISSAKKYVELSNENGWAKLELAYAYAVAGNKPESDKIVSEVIKGPGPFSPYDMATICSVWRDFAGAVGWLNKAIEQRSIDVIWIRVDPRLDTLRSESSFPGIVARLVPRR